MQEKANVQLIKKLNEKRILNLIKERGPISRNELARQSKISKVAISEIVNRLDHAGYILEVGKGKSTKKGGKRPILLKLNPEAGYVFGIEVKRSITTIALANIESKIKDLTRVEYHAGASIDEALSKIFSGIDLLIERNNINRQKLVSIGIGIPGIVNYQKGELQFADTLEGWTKSPLVARFSDYFKVPIILENDVNTITLGEKLLGAGKGKNNLACLLIGEGIGAGIIMGGQLIRGSSGNAGEIGYLDLSHFVTNFSFIKNLYHHQRHFGEILSIINLYNTLNQKLDLDAELIDEFDYDRLTTLVSIIKNNNSVVQEILEEYAYLVALLCTNLIKTINPTLIILNGPVIENSKFLLNMIRQIVKQNMLNIPFEPSTIVAGELQEHAGIKGAIALALQTIFEPPVTKSHNYLKIPERSI